MKYRIVMPLVFLTKKNSFHNINDLPYFSGILYIIPHLITQYKYRSNKSEALCSFPIFFQYLISAVFFKNFSNSKLQITQKPNIENLKFLQKNYTLVLYRDIIRCRR